MRVSCWVDERHPRIVSLSMPALLLEAEVQQLREQAHSAAVSGEGVLTCMWDMVREAAEAAIKSLLDAYSGCSHLLLAQALQKLLTIVTSLGLMRWKTLPFGPKNAPPEFQAAPMIQ